MPFSGKCLAISGGVGGAKLALGLSRILAPEQLTVIANTGDDFIHLGLAISPDLDTVMYTLADVDNKEVGWGQSGESWNFLEALERLGGETWFRLGDRDLATHIFRTQKYLGGSSLSEITRELCLTLGVRQKLAPMTDDKVSTVVNTRDGKTLSFQHYFVRDHCEPVVAGFEFTGIGNASMSEEFSRAITDPALEIVVICPSNPFVSVAPVLRLPGVQDSIMERNVPVVAVSPIIAGQAIKGPAAKMMRELGKPQTASAVAEYYVSEFRGLLTGFVIDSQDENQTGAIRALGLETIVTNTLMLTLQDRIDLADQVLAFTGPRGGTQ
ncbi:MAG: 2-phospho-L-lactate transferase [Gammaproteobacteria bacterium]|nr:2-phospho-L-lactate transferase [Gammaproteobacteria bacterium]